MSTEASLPLRNCEARPWIEDQGASQKPADAVEDVPLDLDLDVSLYRERYQPVQNCHEPRHSSVKGVCWGLVKLSLYREHL